MSKAKTRKARKSPKKARPALEKALKQVDLGDIREQITKLVGNGAMNMVRTTIKEVDNGHYLAMKYLFEIIGLYPAIAVDEGLQEDSLAKTLLRRLRLPEETNPGTEVTKECDMSPGEHERDAVK
jgi:hypothetical protein